MVVDADEVLCEPHGAQSHVGIVTLGHAEFSRVGIVEPAEKIGRTAGTPYEPLNQEQNAHHGGHNGEGNEEKLSDEPSGRRHNDRKASLGLVL